MKLSEVIFLDLEAVDALHQDGIASHGGILGVRDRGLLESAVMAPQAGYYASLSELAAVLCHGLAKNHPFLDGNKRIAITAAAAFLDGNGYQLGFVYTDAWEALILGVAAGSVSREELSRRFADAMGGDEPIEE